MRKEKIRVKKGSRKKIAAAVTVFCLAAGTAGTYGYFTEQEKVTNVFTVGDLEIDLKEPEWSPEEGDGENLCPGACVYKNPTVKNMAEEGSGGTSCYARMTVKILDGQGAPVTDQDVLDLIHTTIRYDATYTGTFSKTGTSEKVVQNRIPGYFLREFASLPMINPLFEKDEVRSTGNTMVFNYLGKDGKGILNPQDEAVLFTNIVIPAEWKQKEMRSLENFRLDIRAQAIQISGFPDKEAAFDALDEEMVKGGSNV